jgi:hypothetical protein
MNKHGDLCRTWQMTETYVTHEYLPGIHTKKIFQKHSVGYSLNEILTRISISSDCAGMCLVWSTMSSWQENLGSTRLRLQLQAGGWCSSLLDWQNHSGKVCTMRFSHCSWHYASTITLFCKSSHAMFSIFRIITTLYIFGAQQFLCELVKVMGTMKQVYFPFFNTNAQDIQILV